MGDLRTPDGDIEFSFNAEIPPNVPESDYELAFIRPETRWMFGKDSAYFYGFKSLTLENGMGVSCI